MKRGLIIGLIILGVVIIFLAIIYSLGNIPVQCTEEAKICPDGTTVSRGGLFCTFEKCPEIEKVYCTAEQRNVEMCIEIYAPVCGYSENDKIFQSYDNYCYACADENVEYYTKEACPELEIKEAGEIVKNPSLGPEGIFGECREGLVEISTYYKTNPICEMGEGGGLICSDCGNDNCEAWENKCNCPEDCMNI